MGADYSAYAVIGVKVNRGDLFTDEKIKAFPHDFPDTFEYDPQTGRSLWQTRSVPITGYNVDDETVAGYALIDAGDGSSYDYIALVAATETGSNGEDDDFEHVPHDLEKEKAKMKAALEPLGLWEGDQFGLWSILWSGA